ncbi:DUF2268 domain-containing protein [Ectobacillus antri]|jgi:uncharacterized protein YjaZ|uniref:DUF2268 domain-containing protein n=1 Tax=Ectobacillus antri TaxID=2486280 RepID=A0ABT6H3P3_9BACI|nr:DUF2268 domain-containing protein [Ectobacillus antri]MDG4656660.1 DUF2268 domain-containing protein [Ectobacillus antri]MDG5753977.1 DUF2268 domain-containing protein [Ectobacillus antri]
MAIIDTYSWLEEHYEKPEEICRHFTEYMPLKPMDIYHFLQSRGMYRPVKGRRNELRERKEVWHILQSEFAALRRWLKGPDVPVYILPADRFNRYIQRQYNGKSGLAFRTCIFLFVSSNNSTDELRAMLTHEYHHVCRLAAFYKEEEKYTLLDTMVLEGLAEAAVAARHTPEMHAAWVSYYTKEEAIRLWHRYIKGHIDVRKGTKLHEELVNGLGRYPRLLGYCVGYHIVQDCLAHHKLNTARLLGIDSRKILQYAEGFSTKD